MRLYLSSYLWGNHPEKITEMLGDNVKRAALITNSGDQFPETGIVERFKQDQAFLSDMGIESERLDLRDYFDASNRETLRKTMERFGLVWIRGANVFVLRRAMAQSGFDKILLDLLKNDRIVYGGYSAGACVMGSTLRGLDLVDDAYITPEKYESEVIWDGLNMLPYAIAPHYKSNHPETALIDKAIEYFQKNNINYKALQDGQAIVVQNGEELILG